MKTLRLIGASCAAALLCGGWALASTVSGIFDGTIAAPDVPPGSQVNSSGAGTNTLRWGSPDYTSSDVVAGDSSALTVNTDTISINATQHGPVRLGTLTWNNQSNWFSGARWDSVIDLTMIFATPAGQVAREFEHPFTYVNTTDEDPNTDVNESAGTVPDLLLGFSPAQSLLAAPIALGNDVVLAGFYFELTDAGTPGTKDTGFDWQGAPAGSRFDTATGAWELREGGTATLGVFATVSTVPLPAGFWLLLSGVGSAALVSHRRRKNI